MSGQTNAELGERIRRLEKRVFELETAAMDPQRRTMERLLEHRRALARLAGCEERFELLTMAIEAVKAGRSWAGGLTRSVSMNQTKSSTVRRLINRGLMDWVEGGTGRVWAARVTNEGRVVAKCSHAADLVLRPRFPSQPASRTGRGYRVVSRRRGSARFPRRRARSGAA